MLEPRLQTTPQRIFVSTNRCSQQLEVVSYCETKETLVFSIIIVV